MLSLRSKILFALVGLAAACTLIAFSSAEPATFAPEEQEFGAWMIAGGFFNPLVLVGGLLFAVTVLSIVVDVRRNRS